MKKIISVLLCVIMLLSASFMSVTASAVSLREGTQAIRDSFEGGMYALDFLYFSPVKGEDDETKYPLVLWLHGNSSGDYPGHQLENSDIHKFASDEFQARFKDTGGAFILLPRDSTTDIALAWDVELDNAKSTMDSFIEEYKDNIDLTRLYVGGNSMGGKAAYKMASGFPNTFAAVFAMSPVYIPTASEMNALKNTAVWIFSNSNDRYPQLSDLSVSTSFDYLNSVSAAPENNRWTVFSQFSHPDGSVDVNEVHNTWIPALNDMFMDNGSEYVNSVTVNGEGERVTLTYPDGLISWLSSQSLEGEHTVGSSRNILTKIMDFFMSIINAIISIFGL